ncbi:MAG: glycine betaine/L-proline ABC transporter substrate-binding protein ProX [Desulfobacteraceae bacterium]|nr:glycine betaine/L-proline ABC transporter substrate-binding protein ProX [Desulfobacteraceae bacterium]
MNLVKKVSFYLFFCMMLMVSAAWASVDKPGEGVTVRPARATWNTGFFQEALVRKGLEALGYKVNRPKDLQNPIFYKSLALGDVDYWTNGWFPMHDSQMPKNFYEVAGLYGYIVKSGGMQGYLVSKRDVEKYNIKSLDDFKREEVKKAFDKNGDGKADLTACPPGWGCEQVIRHHLDVYGLRDSINPVKASYEAGMASALGAYRAGEPIFFYTWAPNWTIFKLKPGRDVMWINVPKIIPLKGQASSVDRMIESGVAGAVTDPVKLGFVVSDIRIAANKKFMDKNPAARKFFEVFTLPLEDINAQNTQMNGGEKSQKAIERHATEWIAKNIIQWNKWLDQARDAAK